MKIAPLANEPEIVMFLCKRLIGKAGNRGLSSDAMIALAVCHGEIPAGYEGPTPMDTDDLSRCCEAFKLAPWKLRQRMLPILAQWTNDLETKRHEREAARV